jgi:hypothetical protein
MKDNKVVRLRRGAIALRQQFAQSRGGVFSDVLSEVEMAAVVSTHVESYRQRVYPPLDTLRLFVGQVLSADRACQDVVGRRLSERLAHGQSASTLNTGSYCDARTRLPVGIPRTLGERIGNRLETAAPQNWRWQGRTVKLFDGTTVSMPDTPNNQNAFPQSREQKPGLGFPIARIGALIGLASGAILGYRVAACKGKGTGEQSLLRDLLEDHIAPGDILLADALLANWWIIERVLAQGGDVVMAQHGSRRTDFMRGKPLGTNDHIVEWPRPPRPKLMSATEYVSYPERLLIREFEAGGRVMVTTLLDPKAALTKALNRLYAMRWHIEVDFRTIKATLQMDVLRCKTQAMVEKEIAVYLLAYNLVRWAMATAATLANVLPRVLSFTGAKRLLAMFADHLRLAVGKRISLMMGIVLANIAALKLPHRPARIEPRAKKRRPKPLPLLSVSRYVAREEIRVRRMLKLVA